MVDLFLKVDLNKQIKFVKAAGKSLMIKLRGFFIILSCYGC